MLWDSGGGCYLEDELLSLYATLPRLTSLWAICIHHRTFRLPWVLDMTPQPKKDV